MSEKRLIMLVSHAFMAIGLGTIGYHLGWWPVIGLFLFAIGNNLEQSNN